jgi:hypothetical protein
MPNACLTFCFSQDTGQQPQQQQQLSSRSECFSLGISNPSPDCLNRAAHPNIRTRLNGIVCLHGPMSYFSKPHSLPLLRCLLHCTSSLHLRRPFSRLLLGRAKRRKQNEFSLHCISCTQPQYPSCPRVAGCKCPDDTVDQNTAPVLIEKGR